jgi:8-oxo-dGTP diphosphatase
MRKSWATISSRTNPASSLRKERWYYICMSTTNIPSIYVILRQDNKIAFLLRTNTGYKDGTYTLPAGHVEDNESYRTAAAREAMEEVGVKIIPGDLEHKYTLQRTEVDNGDVRVDIFFEANKWDGTPSNAEPEKHGELAWFDADNLPLDKIMDYQSDTLSAIARGETYSERGKFENI